MNVASTRHFEDDVLTSGAEYLEGELPLPAVAAAFRSHAPDFDRALFPFDIEPGAARVVEVQNFTGGPEMRRDAQEPDLRQRGAVNRLQVDSENLESRGRQNGVPTGFALLQGPLP